MKNRYIIFFLFIALVVSQTKAQSISFYGGISSIKTSTDGRYLILADGPVSAHNGQYQNILVYDAHNRTSNFLAENSTYGGFSGAMSYMAFSSIGRSGIDIISKSSLVNIESGKVNSLSNEHFIIGVYDDGRVLATKAKIEKKYPATKSQSGLYIYDPSSRETMQIMSEKVDLEKYLASAHKFSPDYHFLWKY